MQENARLILALRDMGLTDKEIGDLIIYIESGNDEYFWGEPDENGIYWIDKLSGSDELRNMVEEGYSAEEIKASWQEDVEQFKELRREYLLYEE